MNAVSTALLALAMSTDAFAAAVGKGAALQRPTWREAVRTGAIFGLIETVTPVLGWALGLAAARHVAAFDHWIAFVLLGGLGVRMVWAGLAGGPEVEAESRPRRHGFWVLALTGLGTSIDAMAVGVGLALVDVAIVPVAVAIGCATTVMVTLGVMLGRVLGAVVGRRAEVVGGLILMAIGTMILVDHLHAA